MRQCFGQGSLPGQAVGDVDRLDDPAGMGRAWELNGNAEEFRNRGFLHLPPLFWPKVGTVVLRWVCKVVLN